MDLGVRGKWAVVCGASKGLGYGCALSLAQEGVNLVINARTAEPLVRRPVTLAALPATIGSVRLTPIC